MTDANDEYEPPELVSFGSLEEITEGSKGKGRGRGRGRGRGASRGDGLGGGR
ncbi:lasso RiPP family leader peptide-containing protein [Halorientalis halophila]|uniref:lasso RiPP family leader peptide-containing protein n=1 Tax=Halorientalis halophila TaxID=3108499 RepID=UPI00300BDB84